MFIFRISKPGFDVLTTTNPKDLIFDSELNHLKTFSAGSFQQNVAASSFNIFFLYHNLGYAPLCVGYYRVLSDPNKWFVCFANPELDVAYRQLSNVVVGIGVDTSKVYFRVRNNSSSSETIEVNYEIFYEGV